MFSYFSPFKQLLMKKSLKTSQEKTEILDKTDIQDKTNNHKTLFEQ